VVGSVVIIDVLLTFILFLVEKSLANINCLLACLSVRKGQKNIDFERYHEVPIRVDRRVSDIEELEYEVRSLVSGMVLWKTRGFLGNHAFSIRVDRRVFDIEELEYEVRSLVSRWI
jgi:hypothetical protein